MKKLLTGEKLDNAVKRLGVSTVGDPITQSRMGNHKADESTLQKRVMDAENHIRQNKLWWLAVFSALAAVISAASTVISVIYLIFH